MINKKTFCLIFSFLFLAVPICTSQTIVSSGQTITFDTDVATYEISGVIIPDANGMLEGTSYGRQKAIFTFSDGIELENGSTVVVQGSNALQLVSTTGDIIVDTTIDLSPATLGRNGEPGLGGNGGGWDGGDEANNDGEGAGEGPGGGLAFYNSAGRTGGGGGYGGDGGAGGHAVANGAIDNGYAYGNAEMYVLLAGSGGSGGKDAGGGGGGGAIALTALAGNISIGATGSIIANGGTVIAPDGTKDFGESGYVAWIAGGGSAPTVPPFSTDGWTRYGGGGGSGGGILLEAGLGIVTVNGVVSAEGGEGANSCDNWDGADHEGGGGGGGGRIAIYSSAGGAPLGIPISITVAGGLNGSSLNPDFEHLRPTGEPKATADSEPGGVGSIYYGTGFVPTVALEPSPAVGATDVSIFTDLGWTPYPEGTLQSLYFDGSLILTDDNTRDSATYTELGGPLPENTTYDWYVNTDGGEYSLWSFTTGNGVPTEYAPFDGAVSRTNSLDWTGIPGDVSYNAYISSSYFAVVARDSGARVNDANVVDTAVPDLAAAGMTLVDNTQYFWAIDCIGPLGEVISGDLLTFMSGLPTAPIKINFQKPVDADNKLPEGYIPDVGLTYRYQNGYTYGLSRDRTGNARNRDSGDANDDEIAAGKVSLPDGSDIEQVTADLGPDHQPLERYDTLGIQSNSRDWAIELGAGSYLVELVMGDPENTGLSGVDIVDGWADDFTDNDPYPQGQSPLGTVVYSGTDPDGEDYFDWYSATVTISSDILSLDLKQDGKICFVDITPVGFTGRPAVTGPVGNTVEINSQVITWEAADANEISHEAFLGLTPDTMISQGTVLLTADPNDQIPVLTDPLTINTRYYCKVVATTPYGTINSSLHSFTTRDTQCTASLAGDISGPEGVADCLVDAYDLAAMALDWLDCTDELTNCGY